MKTISPYMAFLLVLFSCGPASAGRFVNLAETATFPRGEGMGPFLCGHRRGEVALIAEKPFGNWIVVYNGSMGRSWAWVDEFGTSEGMTHSLGMSYQLTDSIFLGLEGDWHFDHSDGSPWEPVGRHMGPNILVETGPLWITAAAHFAVGPDDFNPEQIFQTHVGLPF